MKALFGGMKTTSNDGKEITSVSQRDEHFAVQKQSNGVM